MATATVETDSPEQIRQRQRAGARHDLVDLARSLVASGMLAPAGTRSLAALNQSLPVQHTSEEISGFWISAWEAARKNGNGHGRAAAAPSSAPTTGTASAGVDPDSKNLTDLGNAERFAQQHKGKILFDIAQQQWRVSDGKRWALDCDGMANRLAAITARSIHQEAAKASSKERAEVLSRFACRSENRVPLSSQLELAKTMEGIAFPASAFDKDPWLFNCANGTLDLRTGTLRAFDPKDFITKMSPVAFDPCARHEVFSRVLAEAIPDVDVRNYLQKIVGYSLTGSVDEEIFVFVHGPTGTSKSTMTEALQVVFSDYARTASASTFMKRKDQGNARPDIAELNGARFVLTSEVSSEERFDAELLKSFVSGDRLTARFLYGRNFEFFPVSKLWITGNSRPRADVVDAALFRRLREIPFSVQIPKASQDPAIKREMKDPNGCGTAVLAWAVEGCLLWQRDGLRDPVAVVRAGQEYEAESNPLEEFFEARCLFGPDCVSTLRGMHCAYSTWAEESSIATRFRTSEKRMAAILKTRGCSFEQDAHGRFLRGVKAKIA